MYKVYSNAQNKLLGHKLYKTLKIIGSAFQGTGNDLWESDSVELQSLILIYVLLLLRSRVRELYIQADIVCKSIKQN